jgi:hypothetical protein
VDKHPAWAMHHKASNMVHFFNTGSIGEWRFFFSYIDGEVRNPTSDLPGFADDVTEAVS